MVEAMSGTTTLILGGGFGGLTAATEMRDLLGVEHRIVLVERATHYAMGLGKLAILAGRRRAAEITREYSSLKQRGVEYLNGEVTGFSLRGRRVATTVGELEYDHLIIALGAGVDPGRVPGLEEAGINLYDFEGAARAHRTLLSLHSGKVAFAIFGTPFKCPPAPYEAALLADDLLRRRGTRGDVALHFYTPEPHPLPALGASVGKRVLDILEERGIDYHPKNPPVAADPEARELILEDGTREAYHHLIAVPPHGAPTVVVDAELTDASGWVPVDRHILATSHPKVFAVGDVAGVRMPSGQLLPRAGVFAEGEALVVARNVAAALQGREARERFDGRGYCFLEVGGGLAVRVDGELFAEPSPRGTMGEPSVEGMKEKEEFERERLVRWFGA